MPIVDVHAHCVPEALLETLADPPGVWNVSASRQGDRVEVSIGGPRFTVSPRLRDVAARLDAMDRAGVDVQLVSPWMNLTASAVNAEVAVDFARVSNDAMADVVADRAGRLVGLANLPLQHPSAAARELRRAVADLGMVGAEVATRPAGLELDDDHFEPVWREAEDLDCLVLVHPYESLAGRGVSRHFLGNLVGNPAESTVAIAHLIFGGVLERHPKLRFCFVHGGGFAPYQVGRWDHAFRHEVRGSTARVTRRPSELLRTVYFDTVVHSGGALEYLVDTVGSDRVVLGSDYPFEMGDPDPVGFVRATGLEASTIERLCTDNVRALLGPHAARSKEPSGRDLNS